MTNMTSKSHVDPKGTLQVCWSQFREIAQSENRPELVERLEPEMKRFELGLFRIVVMGEIKKGKTSFVNALLGEQRLLPVASDIATSVVYKVIYGPERKFKVFFKPDIDTGRRRDPLLIQQDEIENYGTEAGNPHNEKQVDFIGVEEPNSLLKEGIVLIDTPGVGGLFKAHRDISWRYAPNADAIFFVLDSVESVMSRDEVAFLKELREKLKKQVFFVQTKIDAVDTEQANSWRERNKDILQKEVGIPKDKIRYFPISSELKVAADEEHDGSLLEESGFLVLSDFIHRGLKAKKDEILAARIAVLLAQPMNEIYSDLQGRMKMLQTQNREEIENVQKELTKAKADFALWERGTFQQEIQDFRSEFEAIKRKYRRLVQETMDPNGSIVTQTINGFREIDFDPKDAVAQSEMIQQAWLGDIMELFAQIQEEYNNDVLTLSGRIAANLQDATDTIGTALNIADAETAGPMVSVDKIHMTFNSFDSLRNAAMSGGLGGSVATTAVILTSFVFPPAGALALIAVAAGTLLGGVMGAQSMAEKQKEEFLSKLKQQLQALASQITRYAMNHFDELGISYEKKIGEFFKETVDNHRKRLEEQSANIGEMIGRSREENAKKTEDVKHSIVKAEHLLRQLKTLIPQ